MTDTIVTETCPYGCDWTYTGDADDAKYNRRLHEELDHRDEIAPPRSVSANELLRVRLCSYGGCGEEADIEGMCFYHARHSTPEAPPLPKVAWRDCQALGCTNEVHKDGLCIDHAPKPRALYEHPEWTRPAVIAAAVRWDAEHGQPPTSTRWTKRQPGWPTYQDVRKHFDTWADFLEGAGFHHNGGRWIADSAAPAAPPTYPDQFDASGSPTSNAVSPEHVAAPEAEPDPEPTPPPEPVDWQHHPDLFWTCTAQEDMDEFGGPGMVDAAMEFDEAVHHAEIALRRLRAAHACLQALSDPLVRRANAVLTGRYGEDEA